MLGLGRAAKNYIESYLKQQLGINPELRKIRRLENEIRSIKIDIARMRKIAHSKQYLEETDGKYYLKEENG